MLLGTIFPIIQTVIQRGGPALDALLGFLKEHGDAADVANLEAMLVEIERRKVLAQPRTIE